MGHSDRYRAAVAGLARDTSILARGDSAGFYRIGTPVLRVVVRSNLRRDLRDLARILA
jgi:hypothetical protein